MSVLLRTALLTMVVALASTATGATTLPRMRKKEELFPTITPVKAVVYPQKAVLHAESLLTFPSPGSYVLVVSNWTSYSEGQRSALEENSLQARLETQSASSTEKSARTEESEERIANQDPDTHNNNNNNNPNDDGIPAAPSPPSSPPRGKGRFVDALVERIEWVYSPVIRTDSTEFRKVMQSIFLETERLAELQDNITLLSSKQVTNDRVKKDLLATLSAQPAGTVTSQVLTTAASNGASTGGGGFATVQRQIQACETREAEMMIERRRLKNQLKISNETLSKAEQLHQSMTARHHMVLKIHVAVSSSRSEYKLLLSGVVARASWKPSYELRLSSTCETEPASAKNAADTRDTNDSDDVSPSVPPSTAPKSESDSCAASASSTVEVSYFAEIEHQFAMDWADVVLELSTGQPTVGASGAQQDVSPRLRPWVLNPYATSAPQSPGFFDGLTGLSGAAASRAELAPISHHHNSNYRRSRPAGNFHHGVHTDNIALSGEEGADQSAQKLQEPIFVEETTVRSNGISDTFSLWGRHTLPNRQRSKILVELLPMPSNLTRAAYPAHSTKVYLQSTLKNTSPFTLLPGRSLLFLDATFVGETTMRLFRLGEYRTIDVGVDPALTVKRHLLATQRNQEQSFLFFGKDEKVVASKYLAVIRSQKKTTVRNLKIYDTIPLVAGDASSLGESSKKTKTLLRTPQYSEPLKSQKDLSLKAGRFLELKGLGVLVGSSSSSSSGSSVEHKRSAAASTPLAVAALPPTPPQQKKYALRVKLFTQPVLLSEALSGAPLLNTGASDGASPNQQDQDRYYPGVSAPVLPIGTVEWTVAKLFPGETMEIPFEFSVITQPGVYLPTLDD